MTVGELLRLALTGIAGDRLEPGTVQTGIMTPYLTFEHAGPINGALRGRSNLQNQTVQLDVWSKTYLEANSVADSVESAMDVQTHVGSPPSFSSTQLSRMYLGMEKDTRLHRVLLEFSIWFYPSP